MAASASALLLMLRRALAAGDSMAASASASLLRRRIPSRCSRGFFRQVWSDLFDILDNLRDSLPMSLTLDDLGNLGTGNFFCGGAELLLVNLGNRGSGNLFRGGDELLLDHFGRHRCDIRSSFTRSSLAKIQKLTILII